jgi:DNA invertase Pin-like site-specific DNA recombinase
MNVTTVADGPDLLGSWIDRTRRQRDLHNQIIGIKCAGDSLCGLRFAFYGRMSTEDFQDKLSSARWQRDFAEELTTGHGTIVADFFDVGVSRRLPWRKRPQAARLLAALADPDRSFDAIVIGEFERAIFGDQLDQLAPIFQRHDMQVWLPELSGPIDFSDPMHLALLKLLAVHSKREVLRARYRALASMRAQVCQQGRNIGGRLPYGYRLVDAGPHPNRAHARWGRRQQRLEPDPATAPHVRWIFNQRLQGHSVASIARTLNEQNVPCPSAADAVRNPHRAGKAWQLNTVAAILANPRYTGRQVWNRQHTDHNPNDHADDLLGRVEAQRWNP